MGLDGIGGSAATGVALRVELSGVHPPPSRLRLKSATYEGFEGRSWRRAGRSARGTLHPDPLTGYELVAGAEAGAARIDLEPIGATGLPVPVEGLRLELDTPVLDLDAGGAVRLRSAPTRLCCTGRARRRLSGADRRTSTTWKSPRSIRTACGSSPHARPGVGGGGKRARPGRPDRAAAADRARLQRRVRRSRRGRSISDFLFRTVPGSCEYFACDGASARRGIPARLVTGFLGARTRLWRRG